MGQSIVLKLLTQQMSNICEPILGAEIKEVFLTLMPSGLSLGERFSNSPQIVLLLNHPKPFPTRLYACVSMLQLCV